MLNSSPVLVHKLTTPSTVYKVCDMGINTNRGRAISSHLSTQQNLAGTQLKRFWLLASVVDCVYNFPYCVPLCTTFGVCNFLRCFLFRAFLKLCLCRPRNFCCRLDYDLKACHDVPEMFVLGLSSQS